VLLWKNDLEQSAMASYKLVRWVIRKNKNCTARVNLHGERKKVFGGVEKHIDYVTLNMLPNETDAELVRCAVAVSPHKWKIALMTNLSKFGGKFGRPIDARLKATLTDRLVSSSNTV
jgi:hypothetical protein